MLDRLLELVGQICQQFGGINRFSAGDAHCLTFSDAERAMAATERLMQDWDLFDRRERLDCRMIVALHKGTLYLFRSYVFGGALNAVSGIVEISQSQSQTDSVIFVTDEVRQELTRTHWNTRFHRVEVGLGDRNQLAGINVFCLEPRGD